MKQYEPFLTVGRCQKDHSLNSNVRNGGKYYYIDGTKTVFSRLYSPANRWEGGGPGTHAAEMAADS